MIFGNNVSIMPKQHNETYLGYKHRVIDIKSDSFCGAKWYNATIWLGSGMTTSCHHPPAHKVSVEEVQLNPKALHNSKQKKQDRAQMKVGERPPGCEYCWKIEDMGRDSVSDRVYKTVIYNDKDLEYAFNLDADADVDLQTLEIAFDRTCQFACSYCNPAFSSTWVKDIRTNGPYVDLISDGRNHFTHEHGGSQLYKFGEINPYVEAFHKWWETDLHKTLKELRVTGGEPLMSAETWKLIDWFKNNKGRSQTRLAINSNLGTQVDIDRLVDAVDGIEIDLYTSNESMGLQAEYIRDGLVFDDWANNVERLLDSGKFRTIHIMSTINALCLDSLDSFLEMIANWKLEYGDNKIFMSLNILRFPSFQSPLVLPDELRTQYKDRIAQFMINHKGYNYIHEFEWAHLQRLVNYLDVVKTPHSDTFDILSLNNDFKKFYQQYDIRRSKNFVETFPLLKTWYESL
jgi:pyruvate-formate lyase-activating enzyme